MKRFLALVAFSTSLSVSPAFAQILAPAPASAARDIAQKKGAVESSAEPASNEVESVCSISVNGTGETFIEPGLPVVFDAYLFIAAADKAATPRLTITDTNETVHHWPLKTAVVAPPADGEVRQLKWTLDPDSTKRLGTGKYFATVALIRGEETLGESAPVVINVVPAGSEKLNDKERARIRLRHVVTTDDPKVIRETAEACLEQNPKSTEALVVLADVAAEAGQLEKAFEHLQRAIRLAQENPAAEPPRALLQRHLAIARAMLEKSQPQIKSSAPEPRKVP